MNAPLLPTIHLNGTSPQDLLDGYRAAMDAVQAAGEALAKCGPNGRDYYPQGPDAIGVAADQHRMRREAVMAVYDELVALAIHCNDAVMEREARRAAWRGGAA